jgi:integrase
MLTIASTDDSAGRTAAAAGSSGADGTAHTHSGSSPRRTERHPDAQSTSVAVRRHLGPRRNVGLPQLTLHGLRHTFATLALRAGVPSKVVAEVLGHTSARTTEDIYTHVTLGMQADATAKVAGVIFPTAR